MQRSKAFLFLGKSHASRKVLSKKKSDNKQKINGRKRILKKKYSLTVILTAQAVHVCKI